MSFSSCLSEYRTLCLSQALDFVLEKNNVIKHAAAVEEPIRRLCYFARMKTDFAAVETGVTLTLYKGCYVTSTGRKTIRPAK